MNQPMVKALACVIALVACAFCFSGCQTERLAPTYFDVPEGSPHTSPELMKKYRETSKNPDAPLRNP